MKRTGPLRYWMRIHAEPTLARGLVGLAGTAAMAFVTWQLGQWFVLAVPGALAWLLAVVLAVTAFTISINLLDRLLFALFIDPHSRLYVFRGNRRRRQLAIQAVATVKGHALALQALDHTPRLTGGASAAEWGELCSDARAVAEKLHNESTTLRPGEMQTYLLSRATDLEALADYAAARASGRTPDARGLAVMADIQNLYLEKRRL